MEIGSFGGFETSDLERAKSEIWLRLVFCVLSGSPRGRRDVKELDRARLVVLENPAVGTDWDGRPLRLPG